MLSATHTESHFSKNPIPPEGVLDTAAILLFI
jgi:hypothetical protein